MMTLKKRRLAALLTYKDMSAMTGIHSDTIRSWEAGHNTKRPLVLLAALEQAERELPDLVTGRSLMARRIAAKVSTRKLARLAGVTSRTIWAAEYRGEGSGKSLRLIAAALRKLESEQAPEPVKSPRTRRRVEQRKKTAVHLVPAAIPALMRASRRTASASRLALIRERASKLTNCAI